MPGSEQPVSSASGAPHHFSGSQGIRHHLGGPLSAAGPGWDHAAAECIRTCGLCPPPPRMNPCTMMRTTGQQSSL
jgi:hypothetical protein